MAYTFNGITKIISFDVSTTSFDVRDLWSRYLDWLLTSDNSKYAIAMRNVGGDPLPGSKELGITYFMMNDWKIRPFEENQVLTVNGNLYSEDGSSPYAPVLGAYNVTILSSVSNLVDSTVQQLPEIEYASFNGGIHLDPILGVDSTTYPAGTPFNPCKTILNAYVIDLARGFNKVYLYGDLDIINFPDGLINNVEVVGVGGHRVHNITIDNTLVENVLITNLNATGSCKNGSNVHIHDCKIENLENVSIVASNSRVNSGHYTYADLERCYIDGDIVLDTNGKFTGIDIVFEGDFTNIDMGANTTVSLDISSGYFLLKNSTTGCLAEFNCKGGELAIESSCIGGELYIEGYGTLYNDSTMTIKGDNLITPEMVLSGGGATAEDIRIEMDTNSIKLDEIHTINKLNPSIPVDFTPTLITAGDIEIELTGDGESRTTATRV